MSEWREISSRSKYRISLWIADSGKAYVKVHVPWEYDSRAMWSCYTSSPSWWQFWRRTIPEAMSQAFDTLEHLVRQEEISRQAEQDAKDLAEEIVKMYAEEP